MRFKAIIRSMGLDTLLPAWPPGPYPEKKLEAKHRSAYCEYLIRRHGTVVEMRHRANGREWLQSAVDTAAPHTIITPYVRYLFAALLFHDSPANVLAIGLGGGAFNRAFTHAFPDSRIHTVDIDPSALRLARQHMGFQTGPNNSVTIMDGREYVHQNAEIWQWVVLDAFHGGSASPHLKTLEFYREIAERLSPGGVLVSNLHAGTQAFYNDVQTLRAAFPTVVLLKVRRRSNIIAIAAGHAVPTITDALRDFDASTLGPSLREQIDFSVFGKSVLKRVPDRKTEGARVLTDSDCR